MGNQGAPGSQQERTAPPRSSTSPPRRLGPLTFSGIAAVVGCVAGLGAVLFRALIAVLHNLLLLGHFSFQYDANAWTPPSPWGPGVMLAPVLGAIAVAFLVKKLRTRSPGPRRARSDGRDSLPQGSDTSDRGLDQVPGLRDFHRQRRFSRAGGPHHPIGSSFGSTLAQLLRLAAWERMTLIACGAGGGIAATFNTPVGGVLFAVEIMMHEVSSRTLVPVIISTVTATSRAADFRHTSVTLIRPSRSSISGSTTCWCWSAASLGILAGLLSAIFIRSISGSKIRTARRRRLSGQRMFGMAIVGVLFYSLFEGFGHSGATGGRGLLRRYQEILTGWHHPAALLILLCAAKLFATGMTLGCGQVCARSLARALSRSHYRAQPGGCRAFTAVSRRRDQPGCIRRCRWRRWWADPPGRLWPQS